MSTNSINNSHSSSKAHSSFDLSKIKISKANIFLLFLGIIIHLIAEGTFMPILVALIYYVTGYFILLALMSGGVWEYRIFSRVFLSGFVAASIASLYRNYAGDNQGDALHFYENSLLDVSEIEKLTSEHALPMFFFWKVYNIANYIGISQEQYVGVFLNVLLVAFSSVVAIKSARLIYGNDIYRFKQLILLISACGMFWLFAGIMIRDSFLLVLVGFLTYVWIYFLKNPRFGFSLFLLIGSSWIGIILFKITRLEYQFIPFAMALSGCAALVIGNNKRNNTSTINLLLFLGLITTVSSLAVFGDYILGMIEHTQGGYYNVTLNEKSQNSLGWSLIVNQSVPVRGVLGSIYLFISPIPFWVGFQLETVYHLFKSFNVIYLYFVVPLIILSLRTLWKKRFYKNPILLFLLFFIIGITLTIALTSLETRHIGNFYIPFLLLSLLPNLQEMVVFKKYKSLLIMYLFGVSLIHLIWIGLKTI